MPKQSVTTIVVVLENLWRCISMLRLVFEICLKWWPISISVYVDYHSYTKFRSLAKQIALWANFIIWLKSLMIAASSLVHGIINVVFVKFINVTQHLYKIYLGTLSCLSCCTSFNVSAHFFFSLGLYQSVGSSVYPCQVHVPLEFFWWHENFLFRMLYPHNWILLLIGI